MRNTERTVISRSLSTEEKQAVENLAKDGFEDFTKRKLTVNYVKEGNFTIAIVKAGRSGVLVGYSKRNPELDRYRDVTGEMVAFTRALKNEPVQL